ncbi:MAG TPA: ABC transporter ATP-binding protein [Burkholderiales bacterium]|nr:ABC transporter ATP-binding protein [Burkholderiales bacterium]
MASLSVIGITKLFGAAAAVRQVSFTAREGEFVSLLGPSGCGKTTTLRMIAGLLYPDEGRVEIGGQDVTSLPPYRRSTSLVFQNYALFPHMTVHDNVAFGLHMHKVPVQEIARRAEDVLALVGMAELRGRYPRQLSGGQQQRVALARSLVLQPSVLLLDEPLSNLDARLREEMRIELRQLQQRLKITAVFVTHDQEEALAISDRIIVMRAGAVEQDGPPAELFNRPRTEFVARFMGSANVLAGTWREGGAFEMRGGLVVFAEKPGVPATRGVVSVRPQNIRISGGDGFPGTVEYLSYRGSFWLCGVRLQSGEYLQVHVPSDEDELRFSSGDRVTLSWDPRHTVPTIADTEQAR